MKVHQNSCMPSPSSSCPGEIFNMSRVQSTGPSVTIKRMRSAKWLLPLLVRELVGSHAAHRQGHGLMRSDLLEISTQTHAGSFVKAYNRNSTGRTPCCILFLPYILVCIQIRNPENLKDIYVYVSLMGTVDLYVLTSWIQVRLEDLRPSGGSYAGGQGAQGAGGNAGKGLAVGCS